MSYIQVVKQVRNLFWMIPILFLSGCPDLKKESTSEKNGIHIYSTWYTFVALKEDGSVIAWGNSNQGGDSSSVADQLRP